MSQPRPGSPGPAGAARRAWIHLVGLIVLVALVEVVSRLQGADGVQGTTDNWLPALPGLFYGTLPVLASVSAGMLVFGSNTPRHALQMALVVTVVMIGLDLLTGGDTSGTVATAFLQSGAISATHTSDFTGVPMLSTMVAWLKGDLVLPATRASTYHAGDAWIRIGFAATKLGFLSLPILLVGVVVGVQAWIADHVTFRRPIDATAAQVTLAWLLAPGIFFFVRSWALRTLFHVLFSNGSLLLLYLPFVVLAVPGTIGWLVARRVSDWLN